MTSSWSTISPELRAIIERACTQRQIQVMQLRLQEPPLSWERIGLMLDVDESAARRLFKRGVRNLQQEVAAMRGLA